ncbi:MAG: FAD-dependent oxidoreductase [Actinomycetota bacterium]|nr:FAD-dependent oxidoreductase [Actinomycetota bacterium]
MDAEADHLLLGGGFAALEVARLLKQADPASRVTMISPSPRLTFRPWLIYLPAGRLPFEHTQIALDRAAAEFGFDLVVDAVRAVDPGTGVVHTDGGRQVSFANVLVATGSVSDRAWIPGASACALFPCDDDDARRLAAEFTDMGERSVTVIVGGQRPGPGLEYAGWLAESARRRGRGVSVTLIDPDRKLAMLGPRGLAKVASFLGERGGRLRFGERVLGVSDSEVAVEGQGRLRSDLTAVVGPLKGVDLALPRDAVDASGFVTVDERFRTPGYDNVFGLGDAVSVPSAPWLPKAMVIARLLAQTVAGNMGFLIN